MSRVFLVTGGAGFIGSSFVRLLASRGDRCVVLDALTYAGHRENLDGVPGVTLAVGDIADTAVVTELLRQHSPAGIVHFAAESHVDRSIDSPGAFIQTNVVGSFNLLRAGHAYWQTLPADRKAAFRFIQVSTDEVYGSLGPTGKFSETSPYAPNSPYSASKAAGDMLARAWFHTYGFPIITTNCSNNYGPRQFPEKLIPYMIHCALAGKPLPVYGDGGNVRDWIHVEDHCAGVLLAFEKGKPGETYCFGGNAERNNLELVKAICAELDQLKPRADKKPHASAIQFVQDRLGHDRRYAIDDSRAEKELGFTRRFGVDDGLRATVRWYLENQAWCEAVIKKGGKPNAGVTK